MRRRDFIKATMLAFLGQALHRFTFASGQPKVAIIGAGVAGLSAAHFLQKYGVSSVVFEASSRIGGRVFTKREANCLFEWGANWIHGNQKNPLFAFARKLKIETNLTPEESRNEQVFLSSKKAIRGAEYQERLKFFRTVEEKLMSRSRGTNVSVSQELDRISKSEKWTQEQMDWARFFFKLYVEENYGAPISDIALSQFSSASWYEGGDYVLPGGYDQIPTNLAKGLQIQLGKKLKKVERISKEEIKLSFEDGAVFVCSQLVITVSLGVLKSGWIDFSPKLPKEKLEAIERLGFGKFTKVFVRLKEDSRKRLISLPTWIKFFDRVTDSGFQFFHLAKFSSCPLLIGIGVGQEAELLENLNGDELKRYVLSRAPFLQADDIVELWSSDWGKNELYRGSYSFPKHGSKDTDFDLLGQSVENVHFAGEACQSDVYGTVEAAFLSGRRMAEKLKLRI